MAYVENLEHSLVTFELDGTGTPKTGFVERQYSATLDGAPMPNRRVREVIGTAELQALIPDQAALTAQVQAFAAEREAAIAERDAAIAEKAPLEQQVSDLQAQIAALQPPTDINGVPQVVTMYQARAALIGAGLYDAVNAAVAASTDQLVVVAWEYATEVRRASPFIAAMQGSLGLDDAAVDALFMAAAAVQ